MSFLRNICLVLIFPLLSQLAYAGDDLDLLVAEGLASNPDLRATQETWLMFDKKVGQATSFDDPQLTFGLNAYPVDSFKDDETPMTGKDITLTQKFPFPGKRDARGEIATQQALWYKWVYEDQRLQLVKKIRDTYYQLYAFDRSIVIMEEDLSILDDFIRLTETRYQVGKGLQQDVLRAQVERSKLMDRLFVQRQERESKLSEFNALLARPSSQTLSTPERLDLPVLSLTLESLQEATEESRPLFMAYRSVIDRYNAQRRLARLDRYPDFGVYAGYRIREDVPGDPVDGADFVSAGVSINLPIFQSRRTDAIAEAAAGERMALRQYEGFRNQVASRIHAAWAQLERTRKQALLLETGIIPQARQVFQSAMAAYRVGKVDFLSLLDALLSLDRYQIDHHRAVAESLRSFAWLEAESGASLYDDFVVGMGVDNEVE